MSGSVTPATAPGKGDVVALLLAAGASRRMGTPKALLPRQGRPMVRYLSEVLYKGGVAAVRLVVAPGSVGEAITAAVAELAFVEVRVNPAPERGMLSSVQTGLESPFPGSSPSSLPCAWMVCPCDLPLLEPESVAQIIACWRSLEGERREAILVPTWQGSRGHPTLFGVRRTADIMGMDSRQVGLNTLLAERSERVVEVPVGSDTILHDADTPEEWRVLTGA